MSAHEKERREMARKSGRNKEIDKNRERERGDREGSGERREEGILSRI